MTADPRLSMGVATFNTFLTLALGCGFQAAAAPTVAVSCPARTAAAPDCTLRWLVAFDTLPVRRTALPALQSIDPVVGTGRGGSTGAGRRPSDGGFTVYLRSAAGRTRAIMSGEHDELQTFRAPIVNYLADQAAPPLHVTMWPNVVPWRWFANVLIGLGLLQGAMVVTRLFRLIRTSS